MTEKQTGGPAFPCFEYIAQDGRKNPEGMTLRDYFAAKAMQGDMTQGIHEDDFLETAARSYKMADAMLKARSA